jgi:TolA-binding protein
MSLGRRQPDPAPSGVNYGVINSGEITGPVQAAAFSQNVSQTNRVAADDGAAKLDDARNSIDDLRQALEQLQEQHAEARRALQVLDEINPRLDEPEREAGALRIMLETLVERCGGIPGVLAAAQLVQSTVMALLPAIS